ncbi:MAG: ribulokinase [Eubacteriales bacterium]
MPKYSIGLDYGTLSCRALLVDVADGREIASTVFEYPHKVIDTLLPDSNIKLGMNWALQHPADWRQAISEVIPSVLSKSQVNAEDIIGIGVDFTSCTILPVDRFGEPLCLKPEWKNHPHSWPKLWKHHAAQKEANRINQVADSRAEAFVSRYGGKQSSEWEIAKVLQILNDDPAVYDAMDRWIQGGDWVVWQLTGLERRQLSTAGFKGIWSKKDGYPDKAFFAALDKRLENYVEEKLTPADTLLPLGSLAGGLTEKMAGITGLKPGTPVSVADLDAQVALPALGITEPGRMLLIIGTSGCNIMLAKEERPVPGVAGIVEDGGGYPGLFCYEAGQNAVGDLFDWFVQRCMPAEYANEALERKISPHQLLREKASVKKPGETGLLALDWWNGNRSILMDADLTGVMVGMNLHTKPEDIYRTLLEATAFGQRVIMEAFKENNVPVYELVCGGGIAAKDEFMMQIYADVMNMELKIARSSQAPALGAAIFGAVAAGKDAGGYAKLEDAAKKMGGVREKTYKPIPENVLIYDRIYTEYKRLHDYFGRGENNVMERLKNIQNNK